MRAWWHDLCLNQAYLQMISPPLSMSTGPDLTFHPHHVQVACAAGASELLAITTHAGPKAPPRCCCKPQGTR